MHLSPRVNLLLAILLGALACVLFWVLRPADEDAPEKAYFYDIEEHRLFAAHRTLIPPIPGVKGRPDAGVRAIVISTTGDPKDESHRQIAYLEKYSPEMKRLLEEVRKARSDGRQPAGVVDRSAASANTWVRRLNDQEWVSLSSTEGERITSEWNRPGPDGKSPVVCSP
jgi:hypothetical protein